MKLLYGNEDFSDGPVGTQHQDEPPVVPVQEKRNENAAELAVQTRTDGRGSARPSPLANWDQKIELQ